GTQTVTPAGSTRTNTHSVPRPTATPTASSATATASSLNAVAVSITSTGAASSRFGSLATAASYCLRTSDSTSAARTGPGLGVRWTRNRSTKPAGNRGSTGAGPSSITGLSGQVSSRSGSSTRRA